MTSPPDMSTPRPCKAGAWYDPARPEDAVRRCERRGPAPRAGLTPLPRLLAVAAIAAAVAPYVHSSPPPSSRAAGAAMAGPPVADVPVATGVKHPEMPTPTDGPHASAVGAPSDPVAVRKLSWAMVVATDGYRALKARMAVPRCRPSKGGHCST